MMTVVDHVRPWLTPRRAFAKSTQLQVGAHMSRNGTGAATAHPAASDGYPFVRAPARPCATSAGIISWYAR